MKFFKRAKIRRELDCLLTIHTLHKQTGGVLANEDTFNEVMWSYCERVSKWKFSPAEVFGLVVKVKPNLGTMITPRDFENIRTFVAKYVSLSEEVVVPHYQMVKLGVALP